MRSVEPERRDPATIPARDLMLPSEAAPEFEGFADEAFGILDRLKEEPHIEQYREEKDDIYRFLKAPFKRYRNDLVVDWVLPNRLDFETERNVFSRLLKNDFGAGGCHYHYWMSFYRPGFRRLTDAQLSHSLWPEGLRVGLVLNAYAKEILRQARKVFECESDTFLERVNPLLETGEWWLRYRTGSMDERHMDPLSEVPEALQRARFFELRTLIPKEEVLTVGAMLSLEALHRIHQVWPVYRLFLSGSS